MKRLSLQWRITLMSVLLIGITCVAAIASIKRELGSKWAVIVVIWQCVIAWAAAFITHLLIH